MADLPPVPIDDITDPDQTRVVLWNSLRFGHAPLSAVGTALRAALKTYFDTLYQPLAARLTSWAAVVRASGFDTFAATPSSANLAALLTDESGTDKVAFITYGTTTPTPTASTGTFTSVSATLAYTRIGDAVFFSAVVTITTNGTAAGFVRLPLPFTIGSQAGAGSGFTSASSANLTVGLQAGATVATILTNAGGYPGANGVNLTVSGAFRV